MLKTMCAVVLVALTVSPFTAPFQTWGSADETRSQMAPPESLSALREDSGSLSAVRAAGPGRPTLAPLLGLTAQKSNVFSRGAGSVARQLETANSTHDHLIRSAVMRL